jgi:hypothetical protein
LISSCFFLHKRTAVFTKASRNLTWRWRGRLCVEEHKYLRSGRGKADVMVTLIVSWCVWWMRLVGYVVNTGEIRTAVILVRNSQTMKQTEKKGLRLFLHSAYQNLFPVTNSLRGAWGSVVVKALRY